MSIKKRLAQVIKKHRRLIWRTVFWYLAGLAVTGLIGGLIIWILKKELPPLAVLETYNTSLITKVYSSDQQLLKEFCLERRELVPLEQIPPHLVEALFSTEDQKFMHHWGVDVFRILQAFYVDIKHRSLDQGASTITQQLARRLHLSTKKTWTRKIKEALTAIKIERTYSKDEILQMYLNESYFGHGRYGIQAAARFYFSKNVADLSVAESALLIALLKAPARYSPLDYPERALTRRNLIIAMMADNDRLSTDAADSLRATPLNLTPSLEAVGLAPYFVEEVRKYLEDTYGVDVLYKGGLSVYTTLDSRLQRYAERAARQHLMKLQALVSGKSPGSYSSFEQILSVKRHPVQLALAALDPATGHILAMIGGRDFEESKFNRATQARRQPGSAFKPFVFTAAIDNGYTPVYTLLDNPIVIPMVDGTEWRPQNYTRDFRGPTTLRDALAHSVNLISIKLIQQVGPAQVIKYAHRMGIVSPLQPVLSMAVGSGGEVTVLEMVSAYGTFAHHGIHARPHYITEIRDHDGNLVQEFTPYREEALREETAYVMNSMLQGVVNRGTGYAARQAKFLRPAGGKTGTTDNHTDVWFIGFTPQIVAGVWVGHDDNTPIGHQITGAGGALPVWTEFMLGALDSLGQPVADFPVPANVVSQHLCAASNLLATAYCPKTFDEVFIKGTEPRTACALHTAVSQTAPDPRADAPVADSLKEKKQKRQGLQF
jgi:penicillin-binding protein 1A